MSAVCQVLRRHLEGHKRELCQKEILYPGQFPQCIGIYKQIF